MTKNMGKAFILISSAENLILEIGKKVKSKEKVFSSSLLEIFMMENLTMAEKKEVGRLFLNLEVFSRGFGKRIGLIQREF